MKIYSPYFIIKTLQEGVLKKYANYLGGRVLDLGCGAKPYRKLLCAAVDYVGMDLGKGVRPDCFGNAQQVPFHDDTFDSVMCTEVLEHLPEPEAAIKEIKRVLKDRGYVYITVPQTWGLHYEPYDYWRFTQYGLMYLLKKNGFTVVEMERAGGFFSMIGQRLVDIIWNLIVSVLRVIIGLRWAERVASALIIPLSLGFYLLGVLADRISKEDVLGWCVLARK